MQYIYDCLLPPEANQIDFDVISIQQYHKNSENIFVMFLYPWLENVSISILSIKAVERLAI